MIKETVIWTLLPDPAAPQSPPGTVQLTLILSIRLSNDEGSPPGTAVLPLSRYTDIADFPHLDYEPFRVIVKKKNGASTTPTATFVDTPPQTALWRALFPGSLIVQPFVFADQVVTAPIESYPARRLSGALSDVYAHFLADAVRGTRSGEERHGGTDGEAWETIDRLVRRVGAPGPADPGNSELRRELLRTGAVPDDDPRDAEGWSRLADFHRPITPTARQRAATGPGTPNPNEFHALLAALADHPVLMAPLGLVRRLTIQIPPDFDERDPVTIQANPDQTVFFQNYRPRTLCTARGGRITLARPDGGSGALHLPLNDTTVYTPVDVDLDAGGLALQNYARALESLPRDEPPPEIRPPALRSGGIFVAEADRQVTFQNILAVLADIDEDLKHNGEGDAKTLNAATVQQGIRVDVHDAGSNRWYPLCRRRGQYTVTGYGNVPVDDEGAVTDALSRGEDAHGTELVKLTQAVLRWDNWSLTAEPRGRSVGLHGEITDPGPATNPALPFTVATDCPDGTLPSLRFGRTYRFRARLVDLAGRSTPFTRAPVAGEPATVPLTFSRYDPVPAPVMVLRRPVTAGESPADLVVRTDNSDPAAPVAGATCERHLLAPKTSVELAERHGVLDLTGEHRTDQAVHSLLTRYDGGKITGTPDPGAGGSPYLDTDTVALPWLPDPISRGTALRGVPGTPELLTRWPAGGTGWYQRLPIRLVVEAGPMNSTQSTAVYDAAARAIRVRLHPAASFPGVLGSLLDPGDEALLGQWRWYTDRVRAASDPNDGPAGPGAAGETYRTGGSAEAPYPGPGEGAESEVHELLAATGGPESFGAPGSSEPDDSIGPVSDAEADSDLRAALDGRLGQLTPTTGLTFVHAVRCPVTPPTFTGPRIGRVPGETVYVLDEPATAVHGPSTLSMYTEATWTEYNDLTGTGLVTSPGRIVLRPETDALGSPEGPTLTKAPFRSRHDPGDTRHRLIRYTPAGTSRFVPYFAERRTVTLHGTAAADVSARGFVPGTVAVRQAVTPLLDDGTPAAPGTGYSVDTDVVVNDPRGTIARKPDGKIPDGTPVEVSYVAPPVVRAGPQVSLHVPSTVRPPAPDVHSLVPAFGWQRTTSGNSTTSIRNEGTVRVHLRRPWYLSGEGELLGVRVVDESTTGYVDPETQKWATTWGRDPIRDPGAAATMAYPRPSNLDPRAVDVGLARGHALGFPVDYDQGRRLWYADVRFLGNDLYQPFVHLMVVRLQPDSLTAPDDLRASTVVDAGWIQVPAYRRAKVDVTGTAENSPVKVTVVAPAPPPGQDGLTSEFTAVIQFRSTTLTDDVGWLTLDTAPPVAMVRDAIGGPVGMWRQTLKLPAALGVRPMRVVIREYDVLADSPEPGRTSRRISYLDTIPL
ncbi:hypothetical protein AB0G74_10100 [Streptomyces sp. NPDC020875]|uniref:hypothetical protein n=1 Tax=Streptomyces sp. NPDC020875 TaxID=3154898 RepID=UPI0033F5E3A9